MKIVFATLTLLGAVIVLFGSPLAGENPIHDYYYGSLEPILPMSFAHVDHVSESCIDCHHNYVDDTGNELCMNCHVSKEELLTNLQQQFHELCRDCHAEKAARGKDGGPPRECMGCHLGDDLP